MLLIHERPSWRVESSLVIDFEQFAEFDHFRRVWEAVKVVRPVRYSLFTFGDSELPYFLLCGPSDTQTTVSIKQGNVKVTRPLIITASSSTPEFRNFFEGADDQKLARFLLARTARFGNLTFTNMVASEQSASDSVEEASARINRQLDDEEEDRVAVLTAPAGLGGVAVLRYCLDRVAQSAPDNLNELRERGFLP